MAQVVPPPSRCGQQGWGVRGPGLAQGVRRLSSPSPSSILFSSLSIHMSSLCLSPPICLSNCPRSLHSSCSSCPCPRASSGSCGRCWPRSWPCGSTCSSSPCGASCAWPGPKYGRMASPRGLAGVGSVAVLGVSRQAKGACYEGMGLHWWGADGRDPQRPWALAELPGGAVNRVASSLQQSWLGALWLVGLWLVAGEQCWKLQTLGTRCPGSSERVELGTGLRERVWECALGGQGPPPTSLSWFPGPCLFPMWPLFSLFLPPDAGHSADHPPVSPECA